MAHLRSIQVSTHTNVMRVCCSFCIAKQHARRVQEKLGIDEGLIYLAGQPARNNEDSDMPAPFRQRRYFYYLTGYVTVRLPMRVY